MTWLHKRELRDNEETEHEDDLRDVAFFKQAPEFYSEFKVMTVPSQFEQHSIDHRVELLSHGRGGGMQSMRSVNSPPGFRSCTQGPSATPSLKAEESAGRWKKLVYAACVLTSIGRQRRVGSEHRVLFLDMSGVIRELLRESSAQFVPLGKMKGRVSMARLSNVVSQRKPHIEPTWLEFLLTRFRRKVYTTPLLYLATLIPTVIPSLSICFAPSKTHSPLTTPGSSQASSCPEAENPTCILPNLIHSGRNSHARNVDSERRTPDMIPLRPRPQIKLTTAAVMGQRKEGGAVAVCQDDNDGTVLCSSEDGMTVRCLVTTHFQDEDQNKDGERAALVIWVQLEKQRKKKWARFAAGIQFQEISLEKVGVVSLLIPRQNDDAITVSFIAVLLQELKLVRVSNTMTVNSTAPVIKTIFRTSAQKRNGLRARRAVPRKQPRIMPLQRLKRTCRLRRRGNIEVEAVNVGQIDPPSKVQQQSGLHKTEPNFISSSKGIPGLRIPWHRKSSGKGFLYLKIRSNLEAAAFEAQMGLFA
ncbi:hypothetical protein K443DRAFT_124945 [Laccaria amethystina LaAM-08-1]|uniref:Uncharacterized protein n=1 Tax=Laccaria amethystina LaAM-08-1 TaxID=1095629 RepID=A0A0C9XBP5_9AGAR|nr:hypothetical protein K443DRAFT_124945 [Laccaria amethystina LaAM-08-1]